jgi:hypothetical protein
MLNRRPIFINGFARGGTNILLNILRSHPDVCSPYGETREVFLGTHGINKWACRVFYYLPLRLYLPAHIFAQYRSESAIAEHTRYPAWLLKHIDWVFYRSKLRARAADQNKYKAEGVEYTVEEIKRSRLLCKNVNAVVFLSDLFRQMYPDAAFIALVRNGLALCEAYKRRKGWSAETTAVMYRNVTQKILADTARYPHSYLIKFEDIVAHPRCSIAHVYDWLDLDLGAVCKIRLQNKHVLSKHGEHQLAHQGAFKELRWYRLDELERYFVQGVNQHQISRLSDKEQADFLRIAGGTMEALGYETSAKATG